MLYIFARQRSSLARTLRRMTRFMENTPLRMVYRRIDRMARKLERNIEAMKKQRPSD
jgi:hypothetical protein